MCIGSDSNTVIDPIHEKGARDRGDRAPLCRAPERPRAAGDCGPTPYLLTVGAATSAHALGLDPAALPQIEISDAEPELAGVAPERLPAALVFGGVRYRIGRSSTFGTQS